MRISLLLKREPFGLVLEQTLSGFLEKHTKRFHRVHWYPGRPDVGAMRRNGEQAWLCNIYLNAIFVLEADRRALDSARREFGRSVARWRRSLQRAYVALAVSNSGARWLAQAGMGISPALPDAEHLMIVAGNHKIRLLDRSKGSVFCIQKSGFSPQWMEREIDGRTQAEKFNVPVPPLTGVAEDRTWFEEGYVNATPANRLSDEVLARQLIGRAAGSIRHLQLCTLQEEDLCGYAERLGERARALANDNDRIDGARTQTVVNTVDRLTCGVASLESVWGGRMVTAVTHGDFQPGNILVNRDGVWLIDWEYSGRRCAGYDALTFDLRSRFPCGLAKRLDRFVEEGPGSAVGEEWRYWPGTDWRTSRSRRLSAMLFVLEELVVHLEENSNPRFVRVGHGLWDVTREARRWLEVLSEHRMTDPT